MKPALIFINGFPNNSRLWEKQVAKFSKNYQVYCADWGRTGQKNPVTQAVQEISAKIKEIKTSNSEQPILIIAHDLGCFIAAEISQLIPTHISGQILVNGLGLKQFSLRWRNIQQWIRSSYVSLLIGIPFLGHLASGQLGNRIRDRFYTLGGVGAKSKIRQTRYNSLKALGSYRELFVLVIGRTFSKLEKITTPTLFISGKQDPFLVEPTSKELNQCYSNYRSVQVRGGHWLPFTHARKINQTIQSYLKTNLRSTL